MQNLWPSLPLRQLGTVGRCRLPGNLRGDAMSDTGNDFDRTDDILTCDVSDEVLRLLRGKRQGTTRFISARRWICAQVLEFAAERFRLSAGQQMKQRYRLPHDDVDRGNQIAIIAMMTNQTPTRPHICVLYDGTRNGNSHHRRKTAARPRMQWNGYWRFADQKRGRETPQNVRS